MNRRPDLRLAAYTHDSHDFWLFLAQRGIRTIVPSNGTRKRPYPFDNQAYQRRKLIERMFRRLNDFGWIATR